MLPDEEIIDGWEDTVVDPGATQDPGWYLPWVDEPADPSWDDPYTGEMPGGINWGEYEDPSLPDENFPEGNLNWDEIFEPEDSWGEE